MNKVFRADLVLAQLQNKLESNKLSVKEKKEIKKQRTFLNTFTISQFLK